MSSKFKRDKLLAAIAAAKALENGVVAPVAVAPVAVAPRPTFMNTVTGTVVVPTLPRVPSADEYRIAQENINSDVVEVVKRKNTKKGNNTKNNTNAGKNRRKTRRLRKRHRNKKYF
jgi:hypothetical protein